MTRGHYNSKHNSVNNDNIDCLKGQIEFYKNKYKNSLDKIEKLKKKSMTENAMRPNTGMLPPFALGPGRVPALKGNLFFRSAAGPHEQVH